MSCKEFFRKIQFYLMIALGIYPACACIVVFVAPEMLSYVWLFSAAYCVLGCLCLILPQKLRLVLGIAGCLLFVVTPMMLLQGNARNIMLLYGAGYSVLMMFSLQMAGWNPDQELAPGWLGACITLLLAGCLLSYYEPRLATVSVWIRVCLFVFVFFALHSLNRGSLQLAAGGRGSISGRMRRENILLILVMFALAILVALIPSIMNLFKALFAWVGQAMEKVSELFPEKSLVESTAPSSSEEIATGEGIEVLKEQARSYHTSAATYVIMAVIAIGMITPVAGYAFYKLATNLWKAARNFVQKILDGAGAVAEDFEDEITDTRIDESELNMESVPKGKQTAGIRLTPTQKIRRRYRSLQAKNPKWLQSSTARENLSEDAAELYEKARYSSHAVTEKDAESFKNKTK